MSQGHVEDLLHLRVVGGDAELHAGRVLRARDVDRHEVLADLGPLDRARARGRHVKDLGPEAANWKTDDMARVIRCNS